MKRLLAGLLLAFAVPAQAWQLDHVEVREQSARYRLELRVRLDVPPERAFAVFNDFRNLTRINDAVEHIALLDSGDPAVTRLYTRVRVCVALFCRRLEQVQDIVRADADGAYGLSATVLPALSNLRYGRAEWRMRDCAGTCLSFVAELEPAFWVPPLIGPWLIERKMASEAIETSRGIERLARGA